jgi:hypothetical protein
MSKVFLPLANEVYKEFKEKYYLVFLMMKEIHQVSRWIPPWK